MVAFFQIIDRLPLTVETLKASKLGKLVVKLVKDPPSPGELTFPFNRPFPFVCPGQTVSGYTSALSERKMRSRFSHQRYTYVLRPFCLDSEKSNRIHVSNFLFVFLSRSQRNAAIKDMASNIERRWRQLVSSAEGTSNTPNSNSTEGGSRQSVFLNRFLTRHFCFDRHKIEEAET